MIRGVFMLTSVVDRMLASATGHRFADRKTALEGKVVWKELASAIGWFQGLEKRKTGGCLAGM